jgi:hypothetical protein
MNRQMPVGRANRLGEPQREIGNFVFLMYFVDKTKVIDK